MEPLRYNLDLSVNCTLTESEKNSLVIVLANAIRGILGEGNGAFSYIPKKEENEMELGLSLLPLDGKWDMEKDMPRCLLA